MLRALSQLGLCTFVTIRHHSPIPALTAPTAAAQSLMYWFRIQTHNCTLTERKCRKCSVGTGFAQMHNCTRTIASVLALVPPCLCTPLYNNACSHSLALQPQLLLNDRSRLERWVSASRCVPLGLTAAGESSNINGLQRWGTWSGWV